MDTVVYHIAMAHGIRLGVAQGLVAAWATTTVEAPPVTQQQN
jgi:hypothetical protein